MPIKGIINSRLGLVVREKEEHLYYCKETEQVFRHPVLTSNGHTFELIFLFDHILKHGLSDPETNEKIHYVEYNLQLKNSIDVDCPENRYPDYERLELFQQLKDIVDAPYASWKQSTYKSGVTALIFLFLVLGISTQVNDEIPPSLILLTLCLGGLSDYTVRLRSNHQYGLFDAGQRASKIIGEEALLMWEVLGDIDPQEMRL